MTENEARDAGSWVAIKQHVEAVWRDGYPSPLVKLFPEWFRVGLSGRVASKLERVLRDTIKLAIVETATHELEALGVASKAAPETFSTHRQSF